MEKQRKLKVIILSTLIIGVLTLTIAFASLSRTLDIGGVGKMDTATWDVHFENLSDASITRDAIELGKPNISLDKGTVENINVKLTKPKDEIRYVVDIVNKGTIDAEVNVMTISDLTEEEKKLIDFGVYYLNGSKINKYDLLESGDVKSIAIKIRYKDDITEYDLPSEPLEINLSCQIEYIQSNAEMVITPENNLENVTSVLSTNSAYKSSDTFFNGAIARETIESITFLSTMKVPTDARTTAWDASLNKDGSVVAWYTDLDNNDLYELNIGGNKKVYAPTDSDYLFYNFINLKEINFNNNFDTSKVLYMGAMFAYNYLLNKLDLSSFETELVLTMESMFLYCKSLVNINGLNASRTEKVAQMFYGCSSLTNLDLSNFNTSKVTDMRQIFDECSSLEKIDFGVFDTSKVIYMNGMFSNCKKLKEIDLSSFNISNASTLVSLFNGCSSLTKINIGNIDFENIQFYDNLFSSVPKGFTIYVKNEFAKNVVLSQRYDANVIIGAPIAYNEEKQLSLASTC